MGVAQLRTAVEIAIRVHTEEGGPVPAGLAFRPRATHLERVAVVTEEFGIDDVLRF